MSSQLQIEEALNLAKQGSALDKDQVDRVLKTLANFECWVPFQKLIEQHTRHGDRADQLQRLVWFAKIQYQNLSDLPGCLNSCELVLRQNKLNYQNFRNDVLYQIINNEEWPTEAAILEHICNLFHDRTDRVRCLERLCLIYEKKLPKEDELSATYEKLLSTDENNIKALKYFKLVYSQENDWLQVRKILERLLKLSEKNEAFRVAQELASLLIYQVDDAKSAIEILDKYCKNSPLDTSNLYYDAFFNTKNWDACIRILEQLLLKSKLAKEKAILNYRLSEILNFKDDLAKSIEKCELALTLDPKLLETYEHLIGVYLLLKDWKNTYRILKLLKQEIQNLFVRERLAEAISRIERSVLNARPT
ncbi:MAG: hypothetical protein KBD78_00700 [Oligoflexales bacterium]|nr:hypothetical protein [Oligoflexales bacterium]